MSDTKIKKLIAETFLEVADALETGQYGKQPVIGFASEGSEHGEDNIERAMELAAAKGLKAVLIKGEDIHSPSAFPPSERSSPPASERLCILPRPQVRPIRTVSAAW